MAFDDYDWENRRKARREGERAQERGTASFRNPYDRWDQRQCHNEWDRAYRSAEYREQERQEEERRENEERQRRHDEQARMEQERAWAEEEWERQREEEESEEPE
jgi:hypothetical protein